MRRERPRVSCAGRPAGPRRAREDRRDDGRGRYKDKDGQEKRAFSVTA